MRAEDSPNFDPVARAYRPLEFLTFGPYLERCRFHFLSKLGHSRRALILGDGDGRFTARLLASNAKVEVDAIDSSSIMLELLAARAARLGPSAEERLRPLQADARKLDFEGTGYDLVVANFFLDCFNVDEIAGLVAKIVPRLAPEAIWLVSEFALPAEGLMKWPSRLIVASLYRAFGLLTGLKVRTLPNYAALLDQAGLSRIAGKRYLKGLLVSELWKLDAQKATTSSPDYSHQ
ncbi:biosynthesis of ubiquinone [Acidisarcina polymorpha]|uniref:Biosynthesis of ubiquinone n=1 Tax=Acidisarcina polymorpha TaxID=2211140 RepID=A0A2Z5G5X3_9BACT|nr:class I SAM-dependent methyltransferase [Acidisarcina polymorpha]AXC14359.1 biosynthesis of ubiquinone [Acidisarcina polymorpha]